MLTKLKITIFLLLIANAQWAFIFSNWTYIKKLEAISQETTRNNEKAYLEAILYHSIESNSDKKRYIDTPQSKSNIEKNTVGESGFIKGTSAYSESFTPKKITIPFIDKEAPISSTNKDIDIALNRGVVNYQVSDIDGNIKR